MEVTLDNKKLDTHELQELTRTLADWELLDSSGLNQLRRRYKNTNYLKAANHIAELAEIADRIDHHPSITFEWGCTTVTWWSHSIQGLQRADFVLAEITDKIFSE